MNSLRIKRREKRAFTNSVYTIIQLHIDRYGNLLIFTIITLKFIPIIILNYQQCKKFICRK